MGESSIQTDYYYTKDTIKHCFEKLFSEVSLLAEEPDEEFEDVLKSLTSDVMPDEYASFDDDVDTSEMPINVQKKNWKSNLHHGGSFRLLPEE